MPWFDGTGPGTFHRARRGILCCGPLGLGEAHPVPGYTGILGTFLRARPLARPFLWQAWPPSPAGLAALPAPGGSPWLAGRCLARPSPRRPAVGT